MESRRNPAGSEPLSLERQLVSYNPYSDSWAILPCEEDRHLQQIYVTQEDEIYALLSEYCEYHGLCRNSNQQYFAEICDKTKHVFFITKYKPESNTWEEITSFDHLGSRQNFGIVAKGNVIYFVGGVKWECGSLRAYFPCVGRYDINKNQWDKTAGRHSWI